MGTTVATNALLERKGERTAAGGHARASATRCASATRTARTSSPVDIGLPELLYERVIEVDERVGAPTATEVRPLDEAARDAALRAAYADGIPRGRHRVRARLSLSRARAARRRARARDRLHRRSRVSHEVEPADEDRAARRHHLVDAYLSPILRRYVDRASLTGGRAGAAACCSCSRMAGLTDARPLPRQGRDPVRARRRHRRRGRRSRAPPASSRIIGFDMGGTSTDVTHYAGELRARVRDRGRPACACARRCWRCTPWPRAAARSAPSTAGASASARNRAGANPGPRAYRRGGPLTVTDCNVLLGKLAAAHSSRRCSAASGASRSTRTACATQFEDSRLVRAAASEPPSPEELADGFLRDRRAKPWPPPSSRSPCRAATTSRATRCSASAARAASTPASSPMRSASTRVLLHPLAGVLSAFGMGLADVRVLRGSGRCGSH